MTQPPITNVKIDAKQIFIDVISQGLLPSLVPIVILKLFIVPNIPYWVCGIAFILAQLLPATLIYLTIRYGQPKNHDNTILRFTDDTLLYREQTIARTAIREVKQSGKRITIFLNDGEKISLWGLGWSETPKDVATAIQRWKSHRNR